MLDLGDSCFEALPSSISHLKHLRFLDISNNQSIISFPNTICKLQSLQTLFLNCTRLEKLPRDFGDLVSLRFLALTTQLKCLPAKGIGSLTSLRYLQIDHCGNLESLFADGMQCLTSLRTFFVYNCERPVSLPQGLRYLTALENLVFHNCEKLNLMEDREDEDIQRGVCKVRSLVTVRVPKLVAVPAWLQGAANTVKRMSCLSTLREIAITGCPELTQDEWHKIAHVPEIYLDGIEIQKQWDISSN
ncbi:hypothetical protein F0562_015436 [Nyssa sinensis]|uniref:Disease resistance R13L4/SHOC-2-like LRR domain-containing protein n=1 Tax=Nyssa sinensis TaxID=561372 RepID=A0A5J4ZKE3_9ASTE|nr:hypothetical protein F0562_015436 [Nyssa sinensis]